MKKILLLFIIATMLLSGCSVSNTEEIETGSRIIMCWIWFAPKGIQTWSFM